MKCWVLTIYIVSLLFPALCTADMRLTDQTVLLFANEEQGKELLGRPDDFVKRMSPFDRAARMKTDIGVSEDEFLKFVASNVARWTPGETAKVELAAEEVKRGMANFPLQFPREIYMVKTTGKEEGHAAYTRDNAIVLPRTVLDSPLLRLQHIIAHELFHILSRNNPALRESLYEIIGFKKCNEIEFPTSLKLRKITNPDAPKNDHLIWVTLKGKRVPVVPILFSATEKYDLRRGGEFFDYLRFHLLVVKKDSGGEKWKPLYHGNDAALLNIKDVSGFFEQVGRNTDYIIHPEEILADNFALLVTGINVVRSPMILEKMLEVLSGAYGD